VVTRSRQALVAAYWRYHQLSAGTRKQRLAGEDLFWACEAVQDAVHDDPTDVLDLIDALLLAPEADPGYVGAGPVEDLICQTGSKYEAALAERCRKDAKWREAMSCVWLDEPDRQKVPLLSVFLPIDNDSPAAK